MEIFKATTQDRSVTKIAHFAQLQGEAPTQTVTQVIVVSNDVIDNATGLEGEAEGIAFCQSLLGEDTQWAQTSYNANFRGKYAGIGDTFDGTNFISPEVLTPPVK